MLRSLALLTLALALPTGAAETIRRCEAADGAVVYSNSDCPPGTRAVKSVAPASRPSPEEVKAAQERAERERAAGQAIGQTRRAPGAGGQQAYVPVEEARRAADCAYLEAEIDASRRLRNVLTTRPYYSADDVEQMDQRTAELAREYRRVCSR